MLRLRFQVLLRREGFQAERSKPAACPVRDVNVGSEVSAAGFVDEPHSQNNPASVGQPGDCSAQNIRLQIDAIQ